MEGVDIIKFKKIVQFFLFAFNLMYINFKTIHHFLIEIFNLYCKLLSLLTLIHIDYLINQFLILLKQHFVP
jgi:hypothetical protein